jgi:prevent-host-death family protein
MDIIPSFEAKTHWSALLKRVSDGEEVVITHRGKAVARLVPEGDCKQLQAHDLLTSFQQVRKNCKLAGEDWKAWREDGRA